MLGTRGHLDGFLHVEVNWIAGIEFYKYSLKCAWVCRFPSAGNKQNLHGICLCEN